MKNVYQRVFYIFIVMDFKISKPTHLFAAFMLLLSLFIFLGMPLLSYLHIISTSSSSTDPFSGLPELVKIIAELFVLALQVILVILFFIIVPFLWYRLVNHFSIKEMMDKILLKRESLSMAVVWGVIGAIISFGIVIALGVLFTLLGFDIQNASNITDLEKIFPLPMILFLITFQPIAEEIFFRGFLLEKISGVSTVAVAIILTSLFFGIAHLLVGNPYPALITGVIGAVFAILVVKTQNLYSSIFAHIIFNITNFLFYILGKMMTS